jgi:hypothetical protein
MASMPDILLCAAGRRRLGWNKIRLTEGFPGYLEY